MDDHGMQHGIDWRGSDLAGWIVTEKLDGCRGYWDGTDMWSRGGHRIAIPESWRSALPHGIPLDGEIYFGKSGRTKCASAVRYGRFLPGMKFAVFDLPDMRIDYMERLCAARVLIRDFSVVTVITARTLISTTDALAELDTVHSREGEGLMCRHPALSYTAGRTPLIVKIKHRWQNDA